MIFFLFFFHIFFYSLSYKWVFYKKGSLPALLLVGKAMHWLCLRKYYYAISGHILIALARALFRYFTYC